MARVRDRAAGLVRRALLWSYRRSQQYGLGPWVQQIRKQRNWKNPLKDLGTKDLPLIPSELHIPKGAKKRSLPGTECFWFHAASVGELEALWPLILHTSSPRVPSRGVGSDKAIKRRLVLTIFSPSAMDPLRRLVAELERNGVEISYWGYSPWEGSWGEWFKQVHPDVFISHKYEAWPDSWISLCEQKIVLVIVGAKERRSLKIAKTVCQGLHGELPRMLLLPFLEKDVGPLQELFPGAQVTAVSDPRWERVFQRMERANPRFQLLKEKFLPHRTAQLRVGVLGSIWQEDLVRLRPLLTHLQDRARGSHQHLVWIVPHKVDRPTIERMMAFFEKEKVRVSLASKALHAGAADPLHGASASSPTFVLVDEMGVLTELYSCADWAYVGGGYGEGVHSTIEPAVHGIPIIIGPKNAEKFCEIEEMLATGQVALTRGDLSLWLSTIESQAYIDRRREWKRNAEAHRGASEEILSAVENFRRI